MFGGFAGELCANVIQIGKWHSSQYVRLEVVNNAVKDVSGDLDVFAIEAGFGIDINAKLLPVLTNDVEDDMVLRHQIVLLAWEGNDTVVQILRGTVAVLLNVTV